MHVGFDATAIPPNRAGAGRYIFSLVEALSRADSDHRFTVFVQSHLIREFQIRSSRFELADVGRLSTRQRLAWEQSRLPRELKRRRVDVLHSPHYTMPLRPPCCVVVTFHDATFITMPELHTRSRRGLLSVMMRVSSRRADRLIAVSASTRADICRILKLDAARVDVVHEAASEIFGSATEDGIAEATSAHGLCPNGYYLFVGVLEPRKNVHGLLDAYARLQGPAAELPLAIAGKPGWMYQQIFARVNELSVSHRVRFLGYVPDADLAALYAGCRAFIYPSLYEGFGLPVLEAIQCGAPVITSNIASLPEVAGDAALLISPTSAEELSGAMSRLAADPELAAELSRRGRLRARSFSWARCAQETMQVYARALNGNTRGGHDVG